MKKLFMIAGPMGVGKTTVCQALKTSLDKSVFLDGDWCWDMHPFNVNEETKLMVLDNICFLLNSFIKCSAYENIIFCWVMHEQKIMEDIWARLDTSNCRILPVCLICSENALKERLQGDIQKGIRCEDVIKRSLERLRLYDTFIGLKLDVTKDTVSDTVQKLLAYAEEKK